MKRKKKDFFSVNKDLKSLADAPTVYEITEQSNDPVRCPIKQYDYYISKWLVALNIVLFV